MGLGKRIEARTVYLMNAGTRDMSAVWPERAKAGRIAEGISQDNSYLPIIYGVDQRDDPLESEESWPKAYPTLGITVHRSTVLERVRAAKRGFGARSLERPEAEFRAVGEGGQRGLARLLGYRELLPGRATRARRLARASLRGGSRSVAVQGLDWILRGMVAPERRRLDRGGWLHLRPGAWARSSRRPKTCRSWIGSRRRREGFS